ncbi:hypothetical protein SSX86_017444 [Deinandra increscens subsp. villosa]|uniref:Uncharacterized protein n=1 Tax=Deinandra increscens subsp. villosa TaxID=3103831 RepID=A0AAP0CZK0_9ASTR
MTSKMYVGKGYSTYTNIPTQHGGYNHDPNHSSNRYAIETKIIDRVRAPASGYTDFAGSPSKVHSPTMSGSPKYAPTNRYEDYEPNHGLKYESSSPPLSENKYNRGYSFEEPKRGNLGPGYVKTGKNSGPNSSWMTTGPPATHHPLTTPTNNINEALGLLEESVYYSPRADPRRRGMLDDLSTRAQPVEAHRRYARPAFVAKQDAYSNFTTARPAYI